VFSAFHVHLDTGLERLKVSLLRPVVKMILPIGFILASTMCQGLGERRCGRLLRKLSTISPVAEIDLVHAYHPLSVVGRVGVEAEIQQPTVRKCLPARPHSALRLKFSASRTRPTSECLRPGSGEDKSLFHYSPYNRWPIEFIYSQVLVFPHGLPTLRASSP
jgi:hypothetical protein